MEGYNPHLSAGRMIHAPDVDAGDVIDEMNVPQTSLIEWHYTVSQPSSDSARTGVVYANVYVDSGGSGGASVTITDTDNTPDIGDTSGFSFTVTNPAGTTVQLKAAAGNSANWVLKARRYLI